MKILSVFMFGVVCHLKRKAIKKRRKFTLLLIAILLISFLNYGCKSNCDTGVEFSSMEHFELNNSYQDMLSLTLSAPSSGYVCLTGSGYTKILYKGGTVWVNISIGKNSGRSNNENQTGVEIPFTMPNGDYTFPFSITAVIPVDAGEHNLYMVGIAGPNQGKCYANYIKLTAIFIQERL